MALCEEFPEQSCVSLAGTIERRLGTVSEKIKKNLKKILKKIFFFNLKNLKLHLKKN